MLRCKLSLLFALFSILALMQCGRKAEPWNVLIVTFDTTRADHLAPYGHARASTPYLSALAEEGIVFEQAITPIPITLPSHTTIMTGKVPFTHGVRDNGLFSVGESQETLAEILSSAGYATAAGIGSFPLTAQFGLNQGFDLYDDALNARYQDLYGRKVYQKGRLFFDERKAARVNEAVLPWLEENHKQPFFLWAHYFDPHHPHEPPRPYDQLFADNPYLGEIAYSDEMFGQLINKLKNLGVYDRTLIVFTSDHGEGNGEHGESTHSLLVYNATLHVPLIIKPPKAMNAEAGIRIPDQVGTVDIFPTVLSALNLPVPEEIQGRDLRSFLMSGSAPENWESLPYYAETLSPRLSHGWGELRAIFEQGMKYIHGPEQELYDLTADADELVDLIAEQPEEARKLRNLLSFYLESHKVENLDSSVEVDEETMERLQALGYVQSAGGKVGPIQERLREDGISPRARVRDNSSYSMAKSLLYKGKHLAAKGLLDNLIANDPENTHYLALRLQVESRLGQTEAALATSKRMLELDTGYPPVEKTLNGMANLYIATGQLGEAFDVLLAAQQQKPNAQGLYMLSRIHALMNDVDSERALLEDALSEEDAHIHARLSLGLNLANRGDLEGAEAQFRQAVADHPYYARAHYNLGTLLVEQQRFDESLPSFRRALTLEPNYLKPYQAVIDILMNLERKEEARTYFDQLADIAPASPEARVAAQLIGL